MGQIGEIPDQAVQRGVSVVFHLHPVFPQMTAVAVMMLPIGIGPAIYFAAVPSWSEIGLLLLLGIATFLSQYCLTRAFVETTVAIVTPAFYLQLPIIAAFAFALYGEEPAVWVWLGGAVIAAGAYYIVRRESR